MQATPTTRGRHALRWVVGAGLVFVVLVLVAVQVARHRADEQWASLERHCADDWLDTRSKWVEDPNKIYALLRRGFAPGVPASLRADWPGTHGGDLFREWRQAMWIGPEFGIRLRQERSLFGSSIGARLFGGRPEQVEAARALFAEAGIELLVEPWHPTYIE